MNTSAQRKIAAGRLRVPSLEDMQAKVASGHYQMHPFPKGFAISEIRKYGADTVLTVLLLSGERFEEWKGEIVAHLEAFGRAHGCNAIEATCRPALEAVLKPLGWKRTPTVHLRKEIR